MLTIRHILVPLDFSACSTAALPYAHTLARRYKAQLTLLHVIPTTMFVIGEIGYRPISEQTFATLTQEALTRLEAIFSPAEREEITVSMKVAYGIPFVEIIQEATEQRVDLVIMGTHGRTGVLHLLLGSVAENVIRQAPCPVLTVRASRTEHTTR